MRETLRDAGALIADRYRLKRRIGSGGMGSVWQAEDIKLKRNVAVKLVAAQARDEGHVVHRFVQEATLIAKLKSPNVVEIHDFGFDDRYPYLVMELLDGESLKERLGRNLRVSLGEAKRWATQLGKALAAAHAMGIVHRDLKPANIIVVSDGEDEIMKVIDFGIAKALDQARITRQMLGGDVLLGTPGFMSPEQVRGEDVDARSDLWALGVILYRAITGEMPFRGSSMDDLLTGILRSDPIPPSRHEPTLPLEADAFMARALAKEPGSRFQTVRELVAAFRSIESMGERTPLTSDNGSEPNPPLAHPGRVTASHRHRPAADDVTRRTAAFEADGTSTVPVTDSRPTETTVTAAASSERATATVAARRRSSTVTLAAGGAAALLVGATIAYVLFRGPSGAEDDEGSGVPTMSGAPGSEQLVDSTTARRSGIEPVATASGATASSEAPLSSASASQAASAEAAPARPGTASTRPTARGKAASAKQPPPPSAPLPSERESPDLFAQPW